tara:strand:+ start:527 stop:739 length:213 start_codon:yes stop_codon:yes gene_type:complete
LTLLLSISSKSLDESEKKATSDPETRAEQHINIKITKKQSATSKLKTCNSNPLKKDKIIEKGGTSKLKII